VITCLIRHMALCKEIAEQTVDFTLKFVCRHDYKLVFGVDVTLGLSKAERLMYGESMMTHAMAFTAVTLDVSNFCLKTSSSLSAVSQMKPPTL
jgi:Aminopeptidase C